jgi:tetratricopeptide (TPR) repeat protein
LHYALGRWQKAVENFERADMIRRDYGYVSERPTNLKNLGEALIGLGEFRAAREKLMTSRNISYRLQMTLVAAYAEIGLARLTFYEGDYDEAQSRLKAARILLDDPDSELDDRITQILILEAMIAGENGDINSGIELAKKSFQIAEAQGYVEETIDSMRVLGILYSRCSKFDLAREWIDRSIDLSQAENNRYSLAKAYFEMGQIYLLQLQTGEGDEVMRIQGCTAFKKARGIFEELDAKYDLGLLIEATQV